MSDRVTVLIADDHEAVRTGVAAILRSDPAIEIVGEAENGFDALTQCTSLAPDVALVDLRMPGTDGIWATERITAETPTRVLVLTTFDSDDLIVRALAAGAHGYLLKATRGAELVQAVHHVAADRHVIDPAVAGSVIAQLNRRPEVQPTPALPTLTAREAEVLALLAQGLTNQQIADRLRIGVTTVKTHVGALYDKTGATSRVQLGALGAGAAGGG
ncbi:response regulator transcription factor [Microbacterium paludicola]|uniref:response regulator n=1 Tax=Microbacterium paludicola TaxID=300019 RepID=UPI0011AB2BC3|nr:response regulator transcription factor [Microbacterium paludicola]